MTKARPMAPSMPLASDWFRDGHKTEVTPSRANETPLPNLIVFLISEVDSKLSWLCLDERRSWAEAMPAILFPHPHPLAWSWGEIEPPRGR